MALPQSMNGWNYGYANPVNYTDPSGLCANGEMTPDGWKCYGGSIYSSNSSTSNNPGVVYYDFETTTYDTPEELTGHHSPFEIADGPSNNTESLIAQPQIPNEPDFSNNVYEGEFIRQFNTEEHEFFHSYNYWALETSAGTAWPLDMLVAAIDLNINGPRFYQLFSLFPDNVPATAIGKNGLKGVNFALGLISNKGVIKNTDEIIELYRAVSKGELDDIIKTGTIRPHPDNKSMD
nr:hypothetical protein [Anaerolineaceae bacterium]